MDFPADRSARAAGFTVIELLIVVALIGLLTLMAFPRLEQFMIRSDVRNARTLAIGLYARARSSALETGRVTTLSFVGNTALITATPRLIAAAGSTEDTLAGPEDLQSLYGVTVTGNPDLILTVDPRGLASSNATSISFSRAGIVDSMAVSGFGRVVK